MKNLVILTLVLLGYQASAQVQSEELKEKYHQFDFWIGDWVVYKYGTDTIAGKSQIQSIIDGVGILENYSVTKGRYKGKSLNKFNPAKNRWEQYWIDNSGVTLFLTGGLRNGKMVLDDKESGDSKKGINRIIWTKMKKGKVRQTWTQSEDGGKTWNVIFDGEYRRK